jgi:tetratricopeptide (TPR) repeat protein
MIMKKVFAIITGIIFVLFLLNTLALAEESEKKPDEKAKIETKVEVHKIVKESDREIGEEQENEELEKDDEGDENDEIFYRKLFEMINRQNEQIQQLKEEIGRLRRLIEERSAPQPMNMESDIRMLEEKVRREPDNAEAHMKLGELYAKRGNINGAISQYEMVTKIKPDLNEPYIALKRLRAMRDQGRQQPMERPIDSEIQKLEEKVKQEPNNYEAYMRLGHLYEEKDRIGAAMERYQKAAKIRPDYEQPGREIDRLKAKQREPRPEMESNAGEIISLNMEFITIKTLDGNKVVAFRVPKVKKDNGEWVPNMDIVEKAKSLGEGAKVRIFWGEIEGRRVIKRIEPFKMERQEGDMPKEGYNRGEVISSNKEEVTIKNLEGETMVFRVPRVKKDNGEWVPTIDVPEKGARIKISWKMVEKRKVITHIEPLDK